MSLFEESVPQWREWQAPPAATTEDKRLGWLNESCDEGMSWLKSQRGAEDFRRAFDTVSGRDTGLPVADYRSRLNPNRLKRNMREIIGAMSKLRPMWGYHSDNKAYADNAMMMNKVTRAIYLEQMFDRSIKSALAWAGTTCSGYIRPRYRRDMAGTGEGNIVLDDYGAPSILPVQMPRDGNLQRAYAVTILDEMPIFEAHAMFPRYQERLRPSSARYWYANDAIRKASTGNILKRIFGSGGRTRPNESALSDLLIPIRYTYVTDLTINTTSAEIPMGDPDAPWHYRVPALGTDIPIGFDLHTRQIKTRKANETDARLYPRRRLLISTDNVIMYDGPSFDWHGMVPLVRFGMDDWPWEPIGFSLVHDGYEINEAIKTLERGFMDKQIAKLDPPLAFDQNAVPLSDARAVDPFMPRGRYGFDGNAAEGAPFHPVAGENIYKIDQVDMAHLQHLYDTLDSQQAVSDAMALAKMRAVGSMDDLEKVMEANGPIIEDMSRSMEPPMRDLGVMIKYLVLQYMNTARVMQYVGEDGITPEIMDYDPVSLVPSHMEGEDPGESPTPKPSRYTQIQRARIFADNLRFFITPNSLHELTQMQMKLSLIQLRKAGIKIDSQTIAEAFSIPNYGSIDGSTVMERFKKEQEMDLEQAARMAAITQEIAPQGGGGPPGAGGKGKGAGGGGPEGRPPSFNAPPSLQTKEGGARTTIATSK